MQHIKDTFKKFDEVVRAVSAFASFEALVTAEGNYRPSIQVGSNSKAKAEIERIKMNIELATAYDLYMEIMGDDRRAYRFG